MDILAQQITDLGSSALKAEALVKERFIDRAKEGLLTRDENQVSHFCVYFLPYNETEKKFFIVHHKKANLWISPGGHIDKGEDLLTALNREIKEELGVQNFFEELPRPFLLTITPIDNTIQPCKEHLDIWFLVKTDGKNFNVDPEEFFDTKWMDAKEAKSFVTEKANLLALETINA